MSMTSSLATAPRAALSAEDHSGDGDDNHQNWNERCDAVERDRRSARETIAGDVILHRAFEKFFACG
jgi:hypothetical protein